MSAEILRRAAALMRERAEAATPGPWRQTGLMIRSGRTSDAPIYAGHSVAACSSAMPYTGCKWHSETPEASREPDASHIASWHPAVALAVADWLDTEADSWASDPADFVGLTYFHAYTVARAYLGESS